MILEGTILMGLDMRLEDFMKELGRERQGNQEFKVTLAA